VSDLVFLTGDFCSGSTLLFTLFRETKEYHCLYEPLHSYIREYLIWPLRVYEHHFFVSDYFEEYKGFNRVDELFDPRWACHDLFLTAADSRDDLYRYISYLIEKSRTRNPKVLLKFNRVNFRLPWLRARFPEAKVVHIYRDKGSQWKSIVARGQEHWGRENIGQDSPHFEGFNIASWCEDLKSVFPELAAEHSQTGFDRFSKLYDRSLVAQQASADISVDYKALCKDFETQCQKMFDVVGCRTEVSRLKHLIVQPESQKRAPIRPNGLSAKAANLVDRLGRKYASVRVRMKESKRT
jgi:hypothetical protein